MVMVVVAGASTPTIKLYKKYLQKSFLYRKKDLFRDKNYHSVRLV